MGAFGIHALNLIVMAKIIDLSDRLFQKETKLQACENEFKYFKPDFTQESELYRVDNEPINIINNAENVPFLQNVAQQTLVDVSDTPFDTTGLSDKEIANLATPRFIEVSELSDAANIQLKQAYEQLNINDDL